MAKNKPAKTEDVILVTLGELLRTQKQIYGLLKEAVDLKRLQLCEDGKLDWDKCSDV